MVDDLEPWTRSVGPERFGRLSQCRERFFLIMETWFINTPSNFQVLKNKLFKNVQEYSSPVTCAGSPGGHKEHAMHPTKPSLLNYNLKGACCIHRGEWNNQSSTCAPFFTGKTEFRLRPIVNPPLKFTRPHRALSPFASLPCRLDICDRLLFALVNVGLGILVCDGSVGARTLRPWE